LKNPDFLSDAIAQARASLAEGGIPIGAVLVCDGEVIGRGYNRRIQHSSAVHHAEINCFENAGRFPSSVYKRSTLYTTLSPCYMCAGAAVLFGVRKVVIGEKRTVNMAESFLREHGVEIEIRDDKECFDLLQDFIAANPEIWDEDKGDN
jgi:cytosine/creatinine deaminase